MLISERMPLKQTGMAEQDKRLWLIWVGLVLAVVVMLPFLVRHPGFFASALSYCVTMFGLA